jgi:fibro-slime domain-containing protein
MGKKFPAHAPALLVVLAFAACKTNTEGTITSLDDGGSTQTSGMGTAGQGGGAGGSGVPGSGGSSGGSQDAGFSFNPVEAGPMAPASDAAAACGMLVATIRDFKDDHPDFEKTIQTVRDLVRVDLGADGKPVYAPPGPTAVTAGAASFDQWYRDVPGVNMRLMIPLPLTQTQPGNFAYSNNAFFPMDNQAFGNQGRSHNYNVTTEIHATFKYRGGERFTFTGDDDVFIFVNRKLALDLGGVHPQQTQTIDFDRQATALGITIGGTYSFDAFHAERHTTESNFRMETSIECLESTIIK